MVVLRANPAEPTDMVGNGRGRLVVRRGLRTALGVRVRGRWWVRAGARGAWAETQQEQVRRKDRHHHHHLPLLLHPPKAHTHLHRLGVVGRAGQNQVDGCDTSAPIAGRAFRLLERGQVARLQLRIRFQVLLLNRMRMRVWIWMWWVSVKEK